MHSRVGDAEGTSRLSAGRFTGRAPIVQRPRTPAFHAGNTGSNPVGGTPRRVRHRVVIRTSGPYRFCFVDSRVSEWSRRSVWSDRHPVKVEAAGSNPVGTANRSVAHYGSLRGLVG